MSIADIGGQVAWLNEKMYVMQSRKYKWRKGHTGYTEQPWLCMHFHTYYRRNYMDNPMSNLHFRFMSIGIKFRDLFMPPGDILTEADIVPGFCVLDYGCGPGSYTIDAAQRVGESGKVYALDIHSLALQSVRNRASKKNLTNIETILSDCATGLESESIDVVLLYDTFHVLGDPDAVLQELHRVLKPASLLSFSDHHMEEADILSQVTEGNLFSLPKKGKKTYTFSRVE